MAVARDNLSRNRLGLEAELGGNMLFDTRVDLGEGADGAGNRAGRDLFAGRHQAGAVAVELGIEAGELEAEGHRLGMDAMTTTNAQGQLVFKGATLECDEQ